MKEYKIIIEYYPECEVEKARVTIDRPGGCSIDYGFMDTAREVSEAIKDAATEIFLMLMHDGMPIKDEG